MDVPIRALEVGGAVTAILYLLFITKRRWIAWPCYILSSMIYIPLFWASQLYSDALLQVFFVGMGCWGWQSWSRLMNDVALVQWGAKRHIFLVLLIAILSLVVGSSVYHASGAGMLAFADAFLLVGSVLTTVLTIERVVENWWYWLAINVTSCIVYGCKGIWITCGLAAVYTVLSIRGLLEWKRIASLTHLNREAY